MPGKDRTNRNGCPQLARIQTDSVVAMLKAFYPGLRFEIGEFSGQEWKLMGTIPPAPTPEGQTQPFWLSLGSKLHLIASENSWLS